MATEAQINANRENAKASTGPRTEEGKSNSSRNNTKFGLFAVNNCVQPEEKEEYADFCTSLWTDLAPLGSVEEVTAAEFVRSAWRLRRCAIAEETLAVQATRQQLYKNRMGHVDNPTCDPVIYSELLPTQNAIDRARTSAHNGMRRAKADLDKIQATRKIPTLSDREPARSIQPLVSEPKSAPAAKPAGPTPTVRTQSDPPPHSQHVRPGPCPCGSGYEFSRCCAIGRPLTPQKAA